MERELMMTGIGGQGVQLAAQILARAAVAEGREVMLFGSYGGMMRGGNTDATLVVGDGPIETPPTIAHSWSAVVMHHDYWEWVQQRLEPNAVVLVNTTVFNVSVDWSPYRLVEGKAPATADDVVMDKATAIQVYAHQSQNIEAERQACEIRMRATRRLGQLLKEREKAKGGRPPETPRDCRYASPRHQNLLRATTSRESCPA